MSITRGQQSNIKVCDASIIVTNTFEATIRHRLTCTETIVPITAHMSCQCVLFTFDLDCADFDSGFHSITITDTTTSTEITTLTTYIN